MKFILDTHAFIWFGSRDPRLARPLVEFICDTRNEVAISVVSIWEIAIKTGLGKLDTGKSVAETLQFVEGNGFLLLTIAPEHLIEYSRLPLYHKDPFDRMLIPRRSGKTRHSSVATPGSIPTASRGCGDAMNHRNES